MEEEPKELALQSADPKVSEKVSIRKLELEANIYNSVIILLGISVILVICLVTYLALHEKVVPEGIIAIGSAALGGLAGILAPSPGSSK
jgi:hypothetical protein